MIPLAAFEAVIGASGVALRIEVTLPIGVRPRQLKVRTLLAGMCLAQADHRPAHLSRVHQALVSLPANGDQVAVVGDNGKMLIFPLAELPEMPRGKGVKLQSYKEGGLRDVSIFASEEGLSTVDASGRTRAWPEWREWTGRRAASGRLAPKGFPATKRFRPR